MRMSSLRRSGKANLEPVEGSVVARGRREEARTIRSPRGLCGREAALLTGNGGHTPLPFVKARRLCKRDLCAKLWTPGD